MISKQLIYMKQDINNLFSQQKEITTEIPAMSFVLDIPKESGKGAEDQYDRLYKIIQGEDQYERLYKIIQGPET